MTQTATTTTGTGGKSLLKWVFIGPMLLFGILYAHHQYVEARDEAADMSLCKNSEGKRIKTPKGYYRSDAGRCISGDKPALPPTPSPVQTRPAVVYATTPVTLAADYEFNIEADGPIMVQYPGEKPVEYVPGKGFTQLPQPRQSGPKVFTDPKDPANGHVAFRLYPVHNAR